MKTGSLFTGYGGLDMAVTEVFGAETIWHCEFDEAPSRVLKHRFSVPNHGDVTQVDWSQVEPVDVLTGGFPCQDVSGAGRKAGMKSGTRSGLWFEMQRAIEALRPQYVVIENVRGLLSARTDTSREVVSFGPKGGRQVGRTDRALGRVLADLADLGFDAEWRGVRASEVGAPHQRFRIFIVAYANLAGPQRSEPASRRLLSARCVATDARGEHRQQWRIAAPGQAESGRALGELAGRGGTSAADAGSYGRYRDEKQDGGSIAGREASCVGNDTDRRPVWGVYESAVRRWEQRLGRLAPSPTEPAPKGGQRLSPRFVEWMMGLPDGWVTDTDTSRNEQLKMLGNGVVPQQAAHALRLALS